MQLFHFVSLVLLCQNIEIEILYNVQILMGPLIGIVPHLTCILCSFYKPQRVTSFIVDGWMDGWMDGWSSF